MNRAIALRPDDAPTTVVGDVPDGVLAAFWEYERALATDDLESLAQSFAPGPQTIRADAAGLLLGSGQIAAFRQARGGAPARDIHELHVRVVAADQVVVMAVNVQNAGGFGIVTQLWQRVDALWKITVAHVSSPSPALDRRIWRVAGHPLIAASRPGPLDGQSVAVKDIFQVAGFTRGAGNPAFLAEGQPATVHADAVEALLRAGAEVGGLATTDEFAYSIAGVNAHYGTPPNPRVPGGLPGGSSSGVATAVALGQASIGLGTDTAGSIRVPASYQGLWGLRTTHGAVSLRGVLALAPGFDTVGWLTREPEILYRCVTSSLAAPEDQTRGTGEFVLADQLADVVTPRAWRAFRSTVSALVGRGSLPSPTPVELPDIRKVFEAFRTVQAAEAWREHGAWVSAHPGALGPDVASRFAWASTVSSRDERSARARLAGVRRALDLVLDGRVLLLPTTASSAPPRNADPAGIELARTSTLVLTCLAAIGGRPAVSTPLLQDGTAPLGLCLVGSQNTDLDLIDQARGLQAAALRRESG
jgi:amidase